MSKTSFDQIFRGVILDNTGPRGRCKVFVPGVFPSVFSNDPVALPWAEPAMSLASGSFTSVSAHINMDDNVSTQAPLCKNETGYCGPPHVGSHVWTFFENGNHNKPVYFAAVQAGDGWFSEHPLQHVFKSDNVRVRIDENPESSESTCKFDTYNQNCTFLSQELAETDVPTRLDIEIYGNVNLHIKGNVNLKVEGDIFEEVIGDKHETHIGNLYKCHIGNTQYTQTGDERLHRTGDYVESSVGDKVICHEGDRTEVISANRSTTIGSADVITVAAERNENFGARNQTITGNSDVQINGNESVSIKGSANESVSGTKSVTVSKNFTLQSAKTLFLNGIKRIIFKTPKPYPRKG
jgi:hypothetical protein